MDNKNSDEENITSVKKLLKESNIPFGKFSSRKSSKGKYTSYTVSVTMDSQDIMEKFYTNLKNIPGVIYAV